MTPFFTNHFKIYKEDTILAMYFPQTSTCPLVVRVVTMHRCIDASRYLGRRYVYRILEVGQPGNFLPMMLGATRQLRERV